ncbi:ethanolamine kinase 1 [Anticarsia gemmatalis]|uniref:ethanolamine kinase 1 n=1 Tax=Anticarsia gemmatalis TaxID=129554 RepID=UPI003F76FA6E
MSCICLAAGDKYIPVQFDENDLNPGVLKVLEAVRPNWIPNNIILKTLTDGITNKLISCRYIESNGVQEIILIRIYGNKTDLFIDRTAEIRNIKTLNVLGLAPKIYGIFENGFAYEYYYGCTLDVNTVIDEKVWPLVAKQMAKMHKVDLGKDVQKETFVWDKTEQFLSLLPETYSTETKQSRFANIFNSVTKLRIEYERLKSFLSKTASPIVFAHNDLLLGNVIYNNQEGTISFIDFEYSAYNYQAFDIANHFNEFVGISIEDIDYNKYPSKDFQLKWIRAYLAEYQSDNNPSDEQIQNVYVEVQQLSLLSHFLWGIWSLVQYEHSTIDFDFLRYAEIRLNRYFEQKDSIFKEIS